MTELKPCPRCLCPFVDHGRPPGPLGDTFSCYGCGLHVQLPAKIENAVELWNAWPRTNSAELAAQATTELANVHRSTNASRLERLTVAIIRGVLAADGGRAADAGPNFSTLQARAIVVFARSLERELAAGE